MSQIWNLIFFQPLVNGLILFYQLVGNLGVAIVALTVVIRAILIPLTIPSMKAAKKMSDLAPELENLKKKYGSDKQKFAKAQMDLYKQKGINPVSGCLPQIVQLVILIALYQAFLEVLKTDGIEVIQKLNTILYPFLHLPESTKINLSFWYLNLSKPDTFNFYNLPLPGLFLILAALTQFLSSKMMQPVLAKQQKIAQKTEEKSDDLATMMQQQMLYLFPAMTILIGYTFPSGLVLYWFVFSLFQLVQQYFLSGWGGLTPWIEKVKIKNFLLEDKEK